MHNPAKPPRHTTNIPSLFILAFWLLKQNARILLVLGVSLTITTIVVSAAPIYANIANIASLQDFLQSSTSHSQIDIQMEQGGIDFTGVPQHPQSGATPKLPGITTNINQQVNTIVDKTIHANGISQFLAPPTLSISLTTIPFLKANKQGNGFTPNPQSLITLNGDVIKQVAPHLQLLKGRLPGEQSSALEVALSDTSAKALHYTIGSTLATNITVIDTTNSVELMTYTVPMKVVGIFHISTQDETYWQGSPFQIETDDTYSVYPFLTSDLQLTQTIDSYIQETYEKGNISSTFGTASQLGISDAINVEWQYPFATAKIQGSDLNTLENELSALNATGLDQNTISTRLHMTNIKLLVPSDDLAAFQQQTQVSQLVMVSFVAIAFLLLFYCMSMMANILVERQAIETARLRSRGTSRWQVFAAQALQVSVLGFIALTIGIFLAVFVASLLAHLTLSGNNVRAINTILSDPLQQVRTILLYPLAAFVIVIASVLISLYRFSALNILSARKATSRSVHKPFWARLQLDLVAIILLIMLYAISQYLLSTQALNANSSLLLLSPLNIITSLLLIIAGLLLFLRIFPWLIAFCQRFFAKKRNATFKLALTHLARSPRQSLRLTLLLAFAIAFVLLSQILYTTQSQRDHDVATQLVGSNIQTTFLPLTMNTTGLHAQTTNYAHIKGVQSVTFGTTRTDIRVANSPDITPTLMAVDASTYANTLVKSSAITNVPISALMQQLVKERVSALHNQAMPALVDTTLWNELHLKPGAPFTLTDDVLIFHCVAIAQIPEIPTLVSGGGVLVDLNTYIAFNNKAPYVGSLNTIPSRIITVDQAWFRTDGSTQTAAAITQAMAKKKVSVSQIEDINSLTSSSHQSPLYALIAGILLLGSIPVLFLALIGNFLVSWFTIRDRLSQFVVLRAIGAEERHIAGILILENAIVYAVSLLLGLLCGAFLALTIVPMLVLTSVTNTSNNISTFISVQQNPPVHIAIPATIWFGLAGLIIVCIVIIGTMIYMVIKPPIARTLRLNVD